MIRNLPDNLTGREFGIAGPDWQGEVDSVCLNDECNFDGSMPAFQVFKVLMIQCPACDREWSEQL